jgi:uncharacterized protein (TIGR02246 family)
MMKVVALLGAILLFFASSMAYAGPAEDAGGVLDAWAKAFTANDAEAVVKLYVPDATLLGTVSPSLAEGSGPIREYFARLPGSGSKVAMGERRIVALGESAAVATGFYEFTAMRSGQPVAIPARFTFVLVKRGTDWLIAHHHSSQRPKP